MLNKTLSLALALSLAAAATSQGALLLTEFVPDPSGTDADREWVELYNTGTTAIDLTNYKIGDEEAAPTAGPGTEGMFQFPAGTIIQPGQVFTLGVKATGFNSLYGFLPNFEFNADTDPTVPNMIKYTSWATGDFALSNGNDQVIILDGDDTIIDRIEHGGNGWAALGANQSYERVPANVDTNTVSDFVVRTSGNATPGVVSVPEPTSIAILGLAATAMIRRRR